MTTGRFCEFLATNNVPPTQWAILAHLRSSTLSQQDLRNRLPWITSNMSSCINALIGKKLIIKHEATASRGATYQMANKGHRLLEKFDSIPSEP